MTTFQQIPLISAPQSLSVTLAGTTYNLALLYRDAPNGGWVLDISDVNDNPIVCGIPLVTGADLLAQYGYLNFGGKLVVVTSGDGDAVPTFDNLGTISNLYFASEP